MIVLFLLAYLIQRLLGYCHHLASAVCRPSVKFNAFNIYEPIVPILAKLGQMDHWWLSLKKWVRQVLQPSNMATVTKNIYTFLYLLSISPLWLLRSQIWRIPFYARHRRGVTWYCPSAMKKNVKDSSSILRCQNVKTELIVIWILI